MDSDARGWLRDAALWTVLGVGFLYATGYLWTEAYYTALSVPPADLLFSSYVFLQASFLPLLAPVAFFVLLFALSSLLPKEDERWGQFHMDALGVAALTAALVGWARTSFVLADDGLRTPWFRLNGTTGVLLALIVLVLWVGSNPRTRLHVGQEGPRPKRDAAGVAVLLLLTFLLWGLASSFHGQSQATDLKQGCSHRDMVFFSPTPPRLENKTYIHVLHNDGRYYVRDPDLEPNSPTFVVPDAEVVSAQLTRQSASC